jgi:hypothetical protein
MEAKAELCVKNTAATPGDITGAWRYGTMETMEAVCLRLRVCSSVEKPAVVQRVEQVQVQALEQAQQRRRLVLEGPMDDPRNTMDNVHVFADG